MSKVQSGVILSNGRAGYGTFSAEKVIPGRERRVVYNRVEGHLTFLYLPD